MSGVVHPPLFCITLRIWRDIFGPSDAVARSLSILCSLIAILLMFCAAMQINGFAAAAWAALIFAVSPTQFWIGEQVRAYAMLQAMGMASVLAVLRLEKTSSLQAAIALGFCVLAMMLIHYFAVGGAIAIAVYVCMHFRGKKLRLALAALIIAAIVFAIVWLPFMWRQREAMHAADSWLSENSPQHVMLTLVRLAVWPWKSAVNYVGDQPWPYLSALVLILPIFMLRRRPSLLMWYLWVWCTLGLLVVLDLARGTKHLSFARYVSLAAPGMFVLFTAMLEGLPALLRHGFPAAVAVASIAFSPMWFSALEEPGWRELGEIVDQHVQPSQVLLFDHGNGAEYLTDVYYLGTAHY
jgi:4-amino-4-deoxy-L-arabinose transferase-like glycosyltransferase